uniref:L1 transposable element RRM domain-containing protein n=1 Tax=Seriola lalandi dorsalis TaxID=1841481 RepID=A0A3B4WX50_SERLL
MLGSLLFSIFINDLQSILSNFSFHYLQMRLSYILLYITYCKSKALFNQISVPYKADSHVNPLRSYISMNKPEATASLPDLPPMEEEQQPLLTEDALDPAFRQTIQEITANITRVIDEKLGPLSQTVQARVRGLENQIQRMAELIDDLENRGRRKNLRVIGLPEDVEGTNPTKFFASWIPNLLELETKAGRVKIERAHRTLAPKPGPNQRPRPVLIRFHNFVDKQRVLDAARRKGIVKYQESSIMFFQDLSASILRKRKGFEDVKKRLRDIGAKYMMLYPATLKIIHDGEARRLFTLRTRNSPFFLIHTTVTQDLTTFLPQNSL